MSTHTNDRNDLSAGAGTSPGPACLVCGSPECKVVHRQLRYDIEHDVAECGNCGFIYLWPRLGEQETVEFYQKGEFRNIPREKLGLQSHDPDGTFESRMGQARHRFRIVKPYLNKDKTLLEIGCGSGSFISLVQPFVKDCTGMELDAIFADYVRRRFGIKVLEDALENLPPRMGPYDLICMWFVLEHLHDPVGDLRKIRELVADHGLLFLLLPNLRDPLLTVYHSKAYERFFYQLPHLNYFSERTLRLALETSGWDGQIIPVQIYGLANHLRWMFLERPQPKQSRGTVDLWNIPDKIYRAMLAKAGTTDSLLVIARKR